MSHTTIHADRLAAMIERGEALWSHPGWGYAAWATGPSFTHDVRVAGPEHFKPCPDRPGYYRAEYELPGWPLSS